MKSKKTKINHMPRSIASKPLEVLRLNSQITKADQLKLSNNMRQCWQKMRDGNGSADDWQMLADCSNVCGLKAEAVGDDMLAACADAAKALQVIQDRADRTGKWATCHLSRQEIDLLMDIHDQLLGLLSYREMMDLAKEAGVKARKIA